MIHNISKFIAALALLATAQGAWADDHVSCRVIIQTPTNGTITVTRNDTHATVTSGDVLPEGTTVTVNATPADGYDLKELRLATYTYGDAPIPGLPPGWVTDGASLISNGATFTIEENKEYIFIATFEQNVVKYSITQNITGQGTLDVTSESVAGNRISVGYTPGDGYRLESLTVTKADNSNVSVTYDAVKDKYYFTMPEANVTINAVFSAVAFFVRFNANGGTGTMADQTIPVGETQALTANAFTREGYIFAGWSETADGSVVYANGQSVTNLATAGETKNLYAQWTATYTVHFNANNGTGAMADQTIAVGATTNLTANAFTRDGYYFEGWNTQTDGLGTNYADGASVTNLTTTAGATFNLYAQWRETVTANYVDASGNAHTLSGCKEITPDHMPTTLSGNYIVSESVTYSSKVTLSGNTTIILANGKTMSIGTEAAPLGGDNAIYASGTNSLTIYGQSLDAATAGSLEVYSTGSAAVKLYDGSYAQHSGNVVVSRSGGSNNNYAINAGGSVTIDGGKLDASITSEGSFAIKASGNISISGGSVTANATGADSYGMRAVNNITLSWNRSTDRITASGYQSTNGTVSLSKRFAFDDGGTVTQATTANMGGQTLRPAVLVTFDTNGGSDVSQQPVIIGTAAIAPTPTLTGYDLSGWTLGGAAYDFATPVTEDITLTAQWTPDPAHFSVSGDEYTIHTAEGWGVFCDCLNDNDTYNRFSGKTVKLADDIIVSRMAGSDKHDFCGTFDGDEHTITLDGNSSNGCYTLFRNAVGATIRDLHVTGTITTAGKYAAGFISGMWGNVTIENCRSSVIIRSSVSGDGTHGGFVAVNNSGTLDITGCTFDGKLLTTGTTATSHCGGFVGWNVGTVTIINSLYAPAAIADGETEVQAGDSNPSATFARNGATITNSYYTRTLGTPQGKQAHSITAGENVTIEAISGTATEYTVSGIIAYKDGETQLSGLKYGDALYAGSEETVSLTLSNTAEAPLGYQYAGYTASAGTLSGNDTDGYTLAMPDQDVTVSLALTVLPWSGDGSEGSPYIIYNKDQLDLLAYRVNGTHGETRQTDGYSGKYFKLNNDISYPHTSNWNDFDSDENNFEAIGGRYNDNFRYFSGHFDGNNKTISGIRIYKGGFGNADKYQGIFGLTDYGADIRDLTLVDARITGYDYTGGIVGYNERGTVTRCHVAGDVAVCAVQYNAYLHGGIVGSNKTGTIEQCTSAATLTTASATNSQFYGGIAGGNGGTLRDNLAIGATVPAAKNNTYGAITGLNGSGSPLLRNYYAACKVANTPNATGVGCEAADVNNDNNPDGAVCINTLALAARQAPDGNYWTTYYNSFLGFTIDAEEHACAYTATYSAGQLTLHNLGKEIPKGTAVIIVADNDEVSMTAATDLPAYSGTNDLRGVDTDTPTDDILADLGDGTLYVLGQTIVDGEKHFGFHHYTGTEMPARKAFVHVASSPEAPARSLTMVFDEASGIESAEADSSLFTLHSSLSSWFTLDGRKLNGKPTKPGLYINNGRKVVIK